MPCGGGWRHREGRLLIRRSMGGEGLEPSHLSARASKTRVSTIPPPAPGVETSAYIPQRSLALHCAVRRADSSDSIAVGPDFRAAPTPRTIDLGTPWSRASVRISPSAPSDRRPWTDSGWWRWGRRKLNLCVEPPASRPRDSLASRRESVLTGRCSRDTSTRSRSLPMAGSSPGRFTRGTHGQVFD